MTTPQVLGERYEIGGVLGRGGMAEVHRGRDLRLGREVAVKVLRQDLARDPSFQVRFRREAQAAASLNHPAIVAVYDTGEDRTANGATPYIVMEYVEGDTLRDVLRREGPLAPERAMALAADICGALDFSHRNGIVHRDVKPGNVMITPQGTVKVMDFGIARAVSDSAATMTSTAAVIGTAQYLSPEQARGEGVDARSDVYSMGCMLYELVTGAPPFTGDSPVSVAYQHVREDPRLPSSINPAIPAELDAILLKSMSKNPANRYQSAADMRNDLLRALAGQRVEATPVMGDAEKTAIIGAPPGGYGPRVRLPRRRGLGRRGRRRPAAQAPDHRDRVGPGGAAPGWGHHRRHPAEQGPRAARRPRHGGGPRRRGQGRGDGAVGHRSGRARGRHGGHRGEPDRGRGPGDPERPGRRRRRSRRAAPSTSSSAADPTRSRCPTWWA